MTTHGLPLPAGNVWSSLPAATWSVTSVTDEGTSFTGLALVASQAAAHCATSVLMRVLLAMSTTGSVSECGLFTADTARSPQVAVRSPRAVTTTFSVVAPAPTVMVSPAANPPGLWTFSTSSPGAATPHSWVVTDGGAVVGAGSTPVRVDPAASNSRPYSSCCSACGWLKLFSVGTVGGYCGPRFWSTARPRSAASAVMTSSLCAHRGVPQPY